LPSKLIIPVENAKEGDWNKDAFWFSPWGESLSPHKGIDVFAKKGTNVLAPVGGIIIVSQIYASKGGNFIYLLGPRWRIYYFAHLDGEQARAGKFVAKGAIIGKVGTSGNAQNKEPHLHFSVMSLFPLINNYRSNVREKHLTMFYLDPTPLLIHSKSNQ